jgi:putative membrane protein
MKRLVILMAGAALTAGCATTEPAPPPPAPVVDVTNPLFAPGYLSMAASSDMYEIQAGQLAQQMSQNAQVRSFGQMLVTDHVRSTQMLMAAAQSAGVTPPPQALTPEHQAMLDQLRASGAGFDELFKQQQITAHQQALTLHQNYAASGDVAALRTVASQIVPVIQSHLTMANSLAVMPSAPPPQPSPTVPSGERG